MSGILATLRRLPGNARGALWMLLAAAAFSGMDATIKALGASVHWLQIALFRCAVGVLVILPFALLCGRAAFRTPRWSSRIGRAMVGYTAMVLGFYAITHLPLAGATALSFAQPLFMIVLAVLFLGETVRWRRWTATAVGFAGVLIMARPSGASFDLAALAAVANALFAAGVGVLTKRQAARERPETIIFYFTLLGSLLALGPALYVWRDPSWVELAALLSVGLLGSLGQYFTIRSYRIAEATAVDPVDYARLVFATLLGFVVFAELPDAWTAAGALVIVASTLYITRREARLGRARAGALSTPLRAHFRPPSVIEPGPPPANAVCGLCG